MSTRLIETLNQHISTSLSLRESMNKMQMESQEFIVQNIKSIFKNISSIWLLSVCIIDNKWIWNYLLLIYKLMATFDNSATNQNYQHLYKSTVISNKTRYSNFGGWCWCRQNSYSAQVIIAHSYLLCRYVKGKLPMNKPSTIGVEFATKNVELKNNQGIVKAQIWDTGNTYFHS